MSNIISYLVVYVIGGGFLGHGRVQLEGCLLFVIILMAFFIFDILVRFFWQGWEIAQYSKYNLNEKVCSITFLEILNLGSCFALFKRIVYLSVIYVLVKGQCLVKMFSKKLRPKFC